MGGGGGRRAIFLRGGSVEVDCPVVGEFVTATMVCGPGLVVLTVVCVVLGVGDERVSCCFWGAGSAIDRPVMARRSALATPPVASARLRLLMLVFGSPNTMK